MTLAQADQVLGRGDDSSPPQACGWSKNPGSANRNLSALTRVDQGHAPKTSFEIRPVGAKYQCYL